IPAEVPRGQLPELMETLAEIIGIPKEDIEARVPPRYHRLFHPMEIAGNVPFQVISALAERRISLPGVTWSNMSVRSYATDMGSLSHIIGYVGDITREELTHLFNYGYQQGDIIGRTGIERQYDDLLRGRHGLETRVVDARGLRIAGQGSRVPPETGKNLVLTIDRRIQTLTEEALGPRVGSIVVLRPGTGEVLAMVSYPWFDPNIFVQGDRVAYQALLAHPHNPLLNRAIQSAYLPASTFKIVLSAAIYSQNIFPPDRTVACPGAIRFGGRLWHCWRRVGHGRMNLTGGLAHSCNIYYWVVGRDFLGVDNIVHYSREMGLGVVTGIDLPGEVAGFIPTPQWKQRRFHENWFDGDTMNMSIGQGWTLTTPLQMANVVAMVVNDGRIYRPHLLKEVRHPITGEVLERTMPTVLHETDIAPGVFASVRSDLRATITDGTARFMNSIRVPVAGKTGTAEVGLQDRWHSWFVAFGPYGSYDVDEQIVVSAIVEAANEWEWWASWATAAILQGIFMDQTFEQAVRSLGLQHIMLRRR
ncbi:MAG: penicillin-binding protein 2, partial [Treponema sp.]|nr:penicillin-binding protein 2 [Treponema sp.]